MWLGPIETRYRPCGPFGPGVSGAIAGVIFIPQRHRLPQFLADDGDEAVNVRLSRVPRGHPAHFAASTIPVIEADPITDTVRHVIRKRGEDRVRLTCLRQGEPRQGAVGDPGLERGA